MSKLDQGRPGQVLGAAASVLRPDDVAWALGAMADRDRRRLAELLGVELPSSARGTERDLGPDAVRAALGSVPDEEVVEVVALLTDLLFGVLMRLLFGDLLRADGAHHPPNVSSADTDGVVGRVMEFLDALAPLLEASLAT